jgi:hypothetical protein
LPNPDIEQLRVIAGLSSLIDNEEEVSLLEEIRELVIASASERDERTQNDLLGALATLKEEAVKPAIKNRLLIRGMIALLKQQENADWREPLHRLEQLTNRN